MDSSQTAHVSYIFPVRAVDGNHSFAHTPCTLSMQPAGYAPSPCTLPQHHRPADTRDTSNEETSWCDTQLIRSFGRAGKTGPASAEEISCPIGLASIQSMCISCSVAEQSLREDSPLPNWASLIDVLDTRGSRSVTCVRRHNHHIGLRSASSLQDPTSSATPVLPQRGETLYTASLTDRRSPGMHQIPGRSTHYISTTSRPCAR
ncbi:hypothetical protein BDW22DRAFT_1353556 [Trametopsis cervina]|nr:hypothetical protein BDW22DRAFT_1353556 [Trametopsis cervina]